MLIWGSPYLIISHHRQRALYLMLHQEFQQPFNRMPNIIPGYGKILLIIEKQLVHIILIC